MKLHELLDTKTDVVWRKSSHYGTTAFAALDNNEIIIKVFFHIIPESGKLHDDHVLIDFTVNGTFGVTSTNRNQFRIFSIVFEIIKEFLNREKSIKYAEFTAKEPSRQKLYSKFIEKYADKFGFELDNTDEEIDDNDNQNYLVYSLKKK